MLTREGEVEGGVGEGGRLPVIESATMAAGATDRYTLPAVIGAGG
jgi:hypothetical protein